MRQTIVVFTKNGRAIRFKVSELPVQNRRGQGIEVVQLHEGDEVTSALLVEDELHS